MTTCLGCNKLGNYSIMSWIRLATILDKVFLIMCDNTFKTKFSNKVIQPVLDAIDNYLLPSSDRQPAGNLFINK